MVTNRGRIRLSSYHVYNQIYLAYSLQEKEKSLKLGLCRPFLMRILLRENPQKFQIDFDSLDTLSRALCYVNHKTALQTANQRKLEFPATLTYIC